MRAIRRFTVRVTLPQPLAPLHELMLNLRWSWHPPTVELFESIDPAGWAASAGDPVAMLSSMRPGQLSALAANQDFLRRLDAAVADLRAYAGEPRWYQSASSGDASAGETRGGETRGGETGGGETGGGETRGGEPRGGEPRGGEQGAGEGESLPKAIAYFSPEYGITAVLPQYSGGLGILAGDHLKSASDLGVPIIGVGLLYRHGYFTQSLSADGWQAERYPADDPNGMPLTLLRSPRPGERPPVPPEGPRPGERSPVPPGPGTGERSPVPPEAASGEPLKITVPLPDGMVLTAQVWLAQVGRVPLLLLDSYVEENEPTQHQVTDRLYGGGSEHRLRQELLLGIGGVRAVRAFCAITGHPEPEVFHTNEGHAGFLGLERIREYVASGLSFDAALELSRAGTVFTTHTPVPAGIDRFPRELIERYFTADAAGAGLPIDRVLALGAETYPGGDHHMFNMAVMGMRLAQRVNGVSVLHGQVSREMFAGLWPGFDTADVPIGSITNGVHAPTWVAREVSDFGDSERAAVADAGRLWEIRHQLRARLVTETRRRLRESWRQRGASGAELTWIDDVLDENVLTIGFARRVPSYKRLTLMLNDPQRLAGLLLDHERPIQIVIAGKAHPADEGGKRLIQQMVRFADADAVRRRIVFLPDYDMALARFLVQGCDVWLNNPLRPLEACGTSGMKVALNGGLNLSVRDGWWDEWYDGGNGWEIPTADGVEDPSRRDELEASALYEVVAKSVAPLFYDSSADGVPHGWVQMVRHGLRSLGPLVQADRMVREYVTTLYAPAAQASRALVSDQNEAARDLAAWKARVRHAWSGVRIEHVEADGAEPSLGAVLDVRVTTSLGDLSADDVCVEVVYGRLDEDDELADPSYVALAADDSAQAPHTRFSGSVELGQPGPFGYTVRVLPSHPLLASRADLGLVAYPDAPAGMSTGDLR